MLPSEQEQYPSATMVDRPAHANAIGLTSAKPPASTRRYITRSFTGSTIARPPPRVETASREPSGEKAHGPLETGRRFAPANGASVRPSSRVNTACRPRPTNPSTDDALPLEVEAGRTVDSRVALATEAKRTSPRTRMRRNRRITERGNTIGNTQTEVDPAQHPNPTLRRQGTLPHTGAADRRRSSGAHHERARGIDRNA